MAEDVFGGVRDAMGLMQTMALMNVYGQKDEARDAELRLKQNEYERKLAEDQVQTSLYKMQTRKAGAEAVALEQKQHDLSLFQMLETKRVKHMLDPDAPGLEANEAAAYNVIGRTYTLIDKFHEPDPLTDAKVANLHAQTKRLDTYLMQTRGWVPMLEQEVGLTGELYGKEAAYREKQETYGITVIDKAIAAAKEKKAPIARILELEQARNKATSQLNQEFGADDPIGAAIQNRSRALPLYHQRAEAAEKRIDELIANPKIKPEDLDQQRVLIQQERDLYQTLERKVGLEVKYLQAWDDESARKPIRTQLDALNKSIEKMAGGFKDSIKAKEEERTTYQLEKLNVQREALGLAKEKHEESKQYQDNLRQAMTELLDAGDSSGKKVAMIATKFGVRPDHLMAVLKNPNQSPVTVNLNKGVNEEIVKKVSESYDAAVQAVDTVGTAYRIENALAEGKVTLGPTATIRNKVSQFAQVLGVSGQNTDEQLVNTRSVIRGLAQFAVGARKSLKGQGQVSDYEGKLIQRAESGEIDDFTLPELKSFVTVTRRLAEEQYKRHGRNVEQLKKLQGGADSASFFEAPPMPAMTPSKNTPASSASSSETDIDALVEKYRKKK